MTTGILCTVVFFILRNTGMQQCINDLDEIALLISGKRFQCVLNTIEEDLVKKTQTIEDTAASARNCRVVSMK